jgi:hypothetical protein
VWSPDGAQILFDSIRDGGVHNLYRKATDGAGADEVILKKAIAFDIRIGRDVEAKRGSCQAWMVPANAR